MKFFLSFVLILLLATAGVASASTWSLSVGVRLSAGGPAPSVVSADFNNDGIPDLVTVAHKKNGSIAFYPGTGKGKFGRKVVTKLALSPANDPVCIVAGDFNGDGKMDLAVSLFDSTDAKVNPGGLAVFLGNGDGTFTVFQTFTVGVRPVSIASGDFNGDGVTDLAVVNFGDNTAASVGTVSVFLGDGHGAFSHAGDFAAGTHARQAAAADINGDGKLDLVVTNLDSDTVSILTGNGDGTFSAPAGITLADGSAFVFPAKSLPWGIAAADLDGDGRVDLAVTESGKRQVDVLFQNNSTVATGKFDAPVVLKSRGGPDLALATDINQDGKTDLLVADGGNNSLSVFLSKGNRQFETEKAFGTGVFPMSIAVSDLNRDGNPDIVTADNNSKALSTFLARVTGKGTWGFAIPAAQFSGGAWPRGLTAPAFTNASTVSADFNRDGRPDRAELDKVNAKVLVKFNNVTGFALHTSIAVTGNPSAIAAADFDRDGKPDIAVSTDAPVVSVFGASAGRVSVLLGDGAGNFPTIKDFGVGLVPASMAVGEFGAPNGFLDIAVSAVFPPDPSLDAVSVLFGQDQFKVNLQFDDTKGTVAQVIDGSELVLPVAGDYFFEAGSSVTLRATPIGAFSFTGWSGAASGSNTDITFTIKSNITIKANFQ